MCSNSDPAQLKINIYVCVNIYIYFLNQPTCYCCFCLVAKSCPTLCNPMDHSPPGPSVYGISQTRILEWVAISFSPTDPGIEPMSPELAGRFFTTEAPGKPYLLFQGEQKIQLLTQKLES